MSEKRTYKLVSDQVRAHCIDEIARAPQFYRIRRGEAWAHIKC